MKNSLLKSPLPVLPEIPSLPKDPKAAFGILWEVHSELKGFLNTCEMAHQKALEDAWDSRVKRGVYSYQKASKKFPEIDDLWRPFAKEVEEKWPGRKEEVETLLRALAEKCPPIPGEDMTFARRVWFGSYYTVDNGNGTYAKASAMRSVQQYQAQGFEAEVRRVEHKATKNPKPLMSYEVWVKADTLEIRLSDYRPGMTLVDWVASCWREGVNPRVYKPMLPHGFEEEHGISRLG